MACVCVFMCLCVHVLVHTCASVLVCICVYVFVCVFIAMHITVTHLQKVFGKVLTLIQTLQVANELCAGHPFANVLKNMTHSTYSMLLVSLDQGWATFELIIRGLSDSLVCIPTSIPLPPHHHHHIASENF